MPTFGKPIASTLRQAPSARMELSRGEANLVCLMELPAELGLNTLDALPDLTDDEAKVASLAKSIARRAAKPLLTLPRIIGLPNVQMNLCTGWPRP